MVRALALLFVLPLATFAQDPPAKKPIDPLARQLEVLHDKKVKSLGLASIKGMTLATLKGKLEREFADDEFRIIIREDLFRLHDPDKEAYGQELFKLDLAPKGLTVHDFLTIALADLDAAYVVRKSYIEITTPQAAVGECYAKGRQVPGEMAAALLRRKPLVSHAATEQTVYDAARQIAFRYGKPVIFDPEIGERRDKTVSPNWTNVPFPTAIRLLALEAGLDVQETRGVLTVTTPGRKKKGK
jgi:hypothetical protein